jgi:hypothetical protein
MTIEIRIGRLALHGLPAGSAARLGAALERELAELVAAGGLPAALATDTHRRRLRAPGPPFPATSRSRLARGLARDIYHALGHLERPDRPAVPQAPAAPDPG